MQEQFDRTRRSACDTVGRMQLAMELGRRTDWNDYIGCSKVNLGLQLTRLRLFLHSPQAADGLPRYTISMKEGALTLHKEGFVYQSACRVCDLRAK